MIEHAMKYVQMAQLVSNELDRSDDDAWHLAQTLDHVQRVLVDAESALVRAYGEWRGAMTRAAELGNKRAAEYLRRTTWDLT